MTLPIQQSTISATDAKPEGSCIAGCATSNNQIEVACKLTSHALRQRKETVLKNLRSQVIARKELENGFHYSFAGSDKMLDELLEFIKTERLCCSFFSFHLFIAGNACEVVLEITGPEGAKNFILTELQL